MRVHAVENLFEADTQRHQCADRLSRKEYTRVRFDQRIRQVIHPFNLETRTALFFLSTFGERAVG
jgi:hypothetical protein